MLDAVRDEACVELIRQEEIVRVLDALTAKGVRPLLFKGAALAYALYGAPTERPRLDTDLLVTIDDLPSVDDTLRGLGFETAARPSGEHVTHQATYVRAGRWGVRSVLDVHWRLADPQAFADLFSYEELAAESVPVAALGRHARALGDVHALLVACTHRVAHHFDEDILIFSRDIDLLARRLDPAGWRQVVGLARQKQICAVVLRGFERARGRFDTPVPASAVASLAAAGPEPTAQFLTSRLRKIDVLGSDLRMLRGWDRVQLIREHLLPPPAYMFRRYPNCHRVLLPALYVHRAVTGAARWLRPLR